MKDGDKGQSVVRMEKGAEDQAEMMRTQSSSH